MHVDVTPVRIEEKSVLRNLMELYLHDFSEIQVRDVNEHGLFGYRYLDQYWTEDERLPFFIRADGKLAGFVLVRRIEERVFSVAEFFVLRAKRRLGVGSAAVKVLLKHFGGRWSFDVVEGNDRALSFWGSIVGGDGQEIDEDGQRVTRFMVDVGRA